MRLACYRFIGSRWHAGIENTEIKCVRKLSIQEYNSMGQIGIWQIVIIAVVVVLLFGRGKISDLMGDVAKGINSFKKGLKDEDAQVADAIDQKESENVTSSKEKSKAS